MSRIRMIGIIFIGTLGLLVVACSDYGNDPAVVLHEDGSEMKRPPMPECVVDESTLETDWAVFSALDSTYFIQETFIVTRGEAFYEVRPAQGYPGFGGVHFGLSIPSGAIPEDPSDPEVAITVAIPAYDSGFDNDSRINLRILSDDSYETELNSSIAAILPRFPWYDAGETLRQYHLLRSDGVPPVYSYRSLQCVVLSPGLSQISLPVVFLPGVDDGVGGGNGGWPTDNGGSSN